MKRTVEQDVFNYHQTRAGVFEIHKLEYIQYSTYVRKYRIYISTVSSPWHLHLIV